MKKHLTKRKNKINRETVRMLLITALVFCVFLAIIGVSWSWFKPLMGNQQVENVTVETANLSIVYNSGPQFTANNILPGWSTTKTFTVTNNGDREAAYNIVWQNITNTFNTRADVVYSITSTNSGGTLSETPFPATGTNQTIISNVTIPANTTQTYTITMRYINRTTEQSDQGSRLAGKIIINETGVTPPTLAEMLVENNPPTTYTTTPGRQISTTDEGLIKGPVDDYGSPTYYFRGAVQDNYVTFAGKTWRVIRINGDGSVRMILNGITGTDSKWVSSNDSTYNSESLTDTYTTAISWLTYSNSSLKTNVESWYSSNIGNNNTYDSKVATGKYCSDKSHTGSTRPIYFEPYNRLYTVSSASPQYTCPNSSDTYSLKVATISADEVAFAGGIRGTDNTSYYLYTGSNYYTMTPLSWNSNGTVTVFRVVSSGYLTYRGVSYSDGIRPVINLNSNVTATLNSSTNPGTSSNPYIVN